MSTGITNPLNGKTIKQGGRLHLKLVAEGIIERSTLDNDKISITNDSRQKMNVVKVEHYEKSTHWVNVCAIADDLKVNKWELISYIANEYSDFKICHSDKSIRIIFPNQEFFIQECVNDFIKAYSKKHKLDSTYWNQ